MPILTIKDIERAINVWRSRKPADVESASLCSEARELANIYSHMIFYRMDEIDADQLNAKQTEAVSVIRAQV